jgi:hypothetical protein
MQRASSSWLWLLLLAGGGNGDFGAAEGVTKIRLNDSASKSNPRPASAIKPVSDHLKERRRVVQEAFATCETKPTTDCHGETSESCGLYTYDEKVGLESLYEQCPNMRGFADDKVDDYPFKQPSCCRDVGQAEEVAGTSLGSSAWLDLLLESMPNTNPLTVTIVGDSTMTNLWMNLSPWIEQGGYEHVRDAQNESPQFHEGWPGERPCGLGVLNASQPWDEGVHQMNYGPHAEKFVHKSSKREIFLQYFPLNSLLAKPQDYRTVGAPMKWYSKGYGEEAIAWRLNCAGEVLTHVANFSDVMILNEGVHYQWEEQDTYRQSISFMFDFFQKSMRSAEARLEIFLAMESVPSHFATNDGSGLFGHQRGKGPRFSSKLFSDCVLKKAANFDKLGDDTVGLTGMKPAPQPPGFHAFPCVPIQNFTLAKWRNDILNSAAAKAQVPVIERFELLSKRCDLHARLHDDCLHYNYGKAGSYMANGIVKAMHGAVTRAFAAKKGKGR